MEINSILCLKRHLKPCRHVTIERPLGYNHHVFIGEVNQNWCDYFHYESSGTYTFSPPGQITKSRFYYSLHKDNKKLNKIFNFHNGEKICVVNRVDYPESKSAEYECIRKANSRLWEREYSTVYNNCESYVNWIFSGDNTSHEYKNAPLLKQMFANALDGLISIGLPFIILYPIEILCTRYTYVFEKNLNDQYVDSTADHQKRKKELCIFENTTLILPSYIEKSNRCNSVDHELFEKNIIMKLPLQLCKTCQPRYRNNVSSGNKMDFICVKLVVFENSNDNIKKGWSFRCGFCEAPNRIKTSQASLCCRHDNLTYNQSVRMNNAEMPSYNQGQQKTYFNEARNCPTNGSNEINRNETNYGLFGIFPIT